MRRRIDIDQALADPNLLGAALGDLAPWETCRVVMRDCAKFPTARGRPARHRAGWDQRELDRCRCAVSFRSVQIFTQVGRDVLRAAGQAPAGSQVAPTSTQSAEARAGPPLAEQKSRVDVVDDDGNAAEFSMRCFSTVNNWPAPPCATGDAARDGIELPVGARSLIQALACDSVRCRGTDRNPIVICRHF